MRPFIRLSDGGLNVRVDGLGFTPHKKISLSYIYNVNIPDGPINHPVGGGEIQANADGSFHNFTFDLQAGKVSNIKVKATDSTPSGDANGELR